MLLRAGDLPRDERWAVEVKFDGCRVQVREHTGAITLRTRPGRLCTDQFPELAGLAHGIPGAILDAELVCPTRPGGLTSVAYAAGWSHTPSPQSSARRPEPPPR